MRAEPAGTHARTAIAEPKEPGLAERKRYFKDAQPATSDVALQQTNNAPGNSEEVTRLYTQLATSFGANDGEAVRFTYRELLRLGRPRMEILAQVARVAAAQEPKAIASDSLAKAITPIEVAAATAAAHAQSRPSIRPASASPDPNPEHSREARPLQQKDRKGSRLLRLNVPTLLRAPAAFFTPLSAAAGTAILINLVHPDPAMISAGATPSVSTPEATAPSIQTAATPSIPPVTQSIETPALAPAEPAKRPERNEVVPHLSADDVAILRARGDALLSTGDVTSSRLFYERAVAAGDAQAAIRLGATYDPVFLSQARLQNVRGNMAIALSWYRRARDLGAVEAETLLKRIEGKSE